MHDCISFPNHDQIGTKPVATPFVGAVPAILSYFCRIITTVSETFDWLLRNIELDVNPICE